MDTSGSSSSSSSGVAVALAATAEGGEDVVAVESSPKSSPPAAGSGSRPEAEVRACFAFTTPGGISFGSFEESPPPVPASTSTPVPAPGPSTSTQLQLQVVHFSQLEQEEEEQAQLVSASAYSTSTASANSATTPASLLAAEEKHLLTFIQNAGNCFSNVFYMRDACLRKLGELWYKISVQFQGHQQQLVFLARIDQLHKFGIGYLELEAVKIRQYFAALCMHYQTVATHCAAEQAGTEPGISYPDFPLIRKIAYELLDNIMILQHQTHELMAKPLGQMEMEMQGMLVAQITNTALALNPYNWQNSAAASKSGHAHTYTYANGAAAANGLNGTSPSLALASVPAPSNPYGLVYGESLSMLGSGSSGYDFGGGGGRGPGAGQ